MKTAWSLNTPVPENLRTMRTSSPSTVGSVKNVLSTEWFLTLEDAKAKIEAWRKDYNERRPHMSLNYT
jgi:transposase InsO family protein